MLPEFPTEAFDLLDQFLHLPSLPVWRVGSGQLLDLAISLVSIIAVIGWRPFQSPGNQIICALVLIDHLSRMNDFHPRGSLQAEASELP